MSKVFRVGVVGSKNVNGCDWYRSFGPLSHLSKTTDQWTIVPISDVTTVEAQFMDMILISRPHAAEHVQMVSEARKLKTPVVVDFDDDTSCVPKDNPSYSIFAMPETQAHAMLCAAYADAITVSTDKLADVWRKRQPDKKVFVVRNALDERLHFESSPGNRDTFMWRGTASHQMDLHIYRDQIFKFFEKYPEQHATFFGFRPWFVTEFLKEHQFTHREASLNVADYLIRMRQDKPRLGFVPLVDNPFNRSKSNIAWLEMTWAGATCLVPDWDEWRHPGAITYSDQDSFLERLDEMADYTPDDIACHHRESWDFIQQEFTLAKWNKVREQVFLAALQRAEWPSAAA